MLEELKHEMQGKWKSIAVEVRPSAIKNEEGSLKPFYLTRNFEYHKDDSFELQVTNFADALGQISLSKMLICGHLKWGEEHPVIQGAFHVEFIADIAYEVMPLNLSFLSVLNQIAIDNFDEWELDVAQSIFRKKFLPFNQIEGQIFKEYDLIYLYDNMLFWGARNIDGRGFDIKANSPLNLQIPMIRE